MWIVGVIAVLLMLTPLIPMWMAFRAAFRVLEQRKYVVPITNDIDKARKAFIKDVRRAEKRMIIFSDSALDVLWNCVVEDIKKQKEIHPELRIDVYVSQEQFGKGGNEAVKQLAQEKLLALHFLKDRPDYDLRLIDDCHFYMVVHGEEGDPKFERALGWRSNEAGARPSDIAKVQQYIDSWISSNTIGKQKVA